jgi:hypothetical protein
MQNLIPLFTLHTHFITTTTSSQHHKLTPLRAVNEFPILFYSLPLIDL